MKLSLGLVFYTESNRKCKQKKQTKNKPMSLVQFNDP